MYREKGNKLAKCAIILTAVGSFLITLLIGICVLIGLRMQDGWVLIVLGILVGVVLFFVVYLVSILIEGFSVIVEYYGIMVDKEEKRAWIKDRFGTYED